MFMFLPLRFSKSRKWWPFENDVRLDPTQNELSNKREKLLDGFNISINYNEIDFNSIGLLSYLHDVDSTSIDFHHNTVPMNDGPNTKKKKTTTFSLSTPPHHSGFILPRSRSIPVFPFYFIFFLIWIMITTANGGKEIADQLTPLTFYFLLNLLFFKKETFFRLMNVNERVGHGLTHSNDKTGFFL